MERVLKSEKLLATDLATGLLAGKKPIIIIYDVPTSLSFEITELGRRAKRISSKEKVKLSHKTENRNAEIVN